MALGPLNWSRLTTVFTCTQTLQNGTEASFENSPYHVVLQSAPHHVVLQSAAYHVVLQSAPKTPPHLDF